jgi:hypothetical protein
VDEVLPAVAEVDLNAGITQQRRGFEELGRRGVPAVLGDDRLAARPQRERRGNPRAREADDQVGPVGQRRAVRGRRSAQRIACW